MFPNDTSGTLAAGGGSGFSTGSVAVVPELGTALLLVSGGFGCVLLRRRRASDYLQRPFPPAVSR